MDWTDSLIRLMAENSRIAKHAHVPMQSGSDAVLRRMHRKYRPWHYREKIEKIRAAMPTAAIGADVMVGFPGETDAEFAETRRLIEDLPLHLSPRLHLLRAPRHARRHDAQSSPGKRRPRPQQNPARPRLRKEAVFHALFRRQESRRDHAKRRPPKIPLAPTPKP